MKANKLMIGDWVILNGNPNPQQVQELLFDSVTIQCWPHRYDDIKPITLTPEILEKNGFKKYGGEYAHLQQWVKEYEKGKFISLVQDTFQNDWHTNSLHITYVHEWQHVLKLCGIEKEITL